MTGQRISNYEVLDKIGEGGMGVVYKARDIRLNRPVAIKFLPPGQFDDAERKQRFMREARAASALNHPNIVTVYDIGDDNGRDYIVMEFMEGKTLDTMIRGGLKLKDSLRIAAQVAGAVGRAHRAGILHRDLKPSNIMVTPDGLAKILDFGLAKVTEPTTNEPETLGADDATKTRQVLTEEGTIAGTVAYMSPEQADGKKLDSRSDVFSFGSVLYEMLHGKRAFPGGSRVSVMAAILEREPERNEKVPPEIDRLVRRCLRKEPERRWQSMDDLKLALEEFAEDSVSGTSIPPSPAAPRIGGNWLVAGGILAALAAGVATAVYFRSPNPPNPGPVLSRLTEDGGVSVNPSLSPDGKLVAYASDRSGEGNLDIWVKQTAGGEPVRVTKDQADETDPSFSANSSQIAFRSQRDGGGVYVVSALGGEAKLFAPNGRSPKFSPDGKWLAYFKGEVGGPQNRSELYVMPAAGGASKKIEKAALLGAGNLVWSPDSAQVLVVALNPAINSSDWWLLNPAGGAPLALNARARISGGFPMPRAWLNQFVYFDFGSDLWRVRIARSELQSAAERITAGTSLLSQVTAAAGPDGKPLLALSSGESDLNIWFVPMDTLQGKVRGAPRRLTDSLAAESFPFVSRNGARMAFRRGRRAWVKDLATGKETEGPESSYAPGLDFDGGKLTYPAAGKMWMVTPPLQTPVALHDENARTLDFTRNGAFALFKPILPNTDPADKKVFLLDMATLAKSVLTEHPSWNVSGAQLSPDDQWFAGHVQPNLITRKIFVAPFRTSPTVRPDEWVFVTDGRHLDRLPRWSPDGRLIYFLSMRDSFQCVWAVSFDAVRKKVGDPFPVFHAHSPRLTLGYSSDVSVIGLGVKRDGLVFTMQERSANVWLAQMP